MNKVAIEKALDKYGIALTEISDLEEKKKSLINGIMADIPPEIRNRLDAVEAEFSGPLDEAQKKIADLSEFIKNGTLQLEESVQGAAHECVFVGGKVKWDHKGLEREAKKIPHILNYRGYGDPYVTLRKRK